MREKARIGEGSRDQNETLQAPEMTRLVNQPVFRRAVVLLSPTSTSQHLVLMFGRRQAYGAEYAPRRHRHRRTSIFTAFILFAAFILLLLVALSLPIIKSIYLLELAANDIDGLSVVGTSVRFGVWGFCINRYVADFLVLCLWVSYVVIVRLYPQVHSPTTGTVKARSLDTQLTQISSGSSPASTQTLVWSCVG
jgi:hypothetical protein